MKNKIEAVTFKNNKPKTPVVHLHPWANDRKAQTMNNVLHGRKNKKHNKFFDRTLVSKQNARKWRYGIVNRRRKRHKVKRYIWRSSLKCYRLNFLRPLKVALSRKFNIVQYKKHLGLNIRQFKNQRARVLDNNKWLFKLMRKFRRTFPKVGLKRITHLKHIVRSRQVARSWRRICVSKLSQLQKWRRKLTSYVLVLHSKTISKKRQRRLKVRLKIYLQHLYKLIKIRPSQHLRVTLKSNLITQKLNLLEEVSREDTFIKRSFFWNRVRRYAKHRNTQRYYAARKRKARFIALHPRYWVSRFRLRLDPTKKGQRLRKRLYSRIGTHHKYPWLNPILYKQQLYSWRQRMIYMRLKRPTYHKRNQIYFQYTRILFGKWDPSLKRPHCFKLKIILYKLVLAFYGHLKLKQFRQIVKTNNRLKPAFNSKMSYLLNKLERRVDVVAYRLNFAPTIQWATELVKMGAISVDSQIVYKPQFLVPNFSIVQYNVVKAWRQKFKSFFRKKLFKKIIPSHLLFSKKVAAGLFLRGPNKDSISENDRTAFHHVNVVRLIN